MDTASEENATPQKHSKEQIDLLDFIPELGEMSPISDFKGPRTPSRRQVLHHFLYFVALGCSLFDAGTKVVTNILTQHGNPKGTKTEKTLRGDVMSLWKNARFKKILCSNQR